ncbi:alkaline phosphatase [Vibrio variabilis]|uniref:alkaline phosphatase n=1 Tax=Vibrio variabilis TaxID=990271 RepID=UPI000DD7277B|nr:alkaline phosphatase [Vibrio variabilis]
MNLNKNLIATSILASLFLSGCNSSDENTVDGKDQSESQTKNVIVMITDGASDGAWDIASFWQHGELLNDTFPFNELDTRYAMSTYALNGNSAPDNSPSCDPNAYAEGFSYSAEKASSDAAAAVADKVFAGYEYLDTNYTDSAASGTAIATGQSTYNGAISIDSCGNELKLITEYAHDNKLSTGIVSTVQFSHATPAVFGAKNNSRSNYTEIGTAMLKNGYADLIMGAGHPMYDGNGKARGQDEINYKYIGEDTWNKLQAGTLVSSSSETLGASLTPR